MGGGEGKHSGGIPRSKMVYQQRVIKQEKKSDIYIIERRKK